MVRDWIAQTEAMPLSTENQQWIKDEIRSALKDAISPPNRVLRAVKDWGLTATLITVPIALVAISVTLGIRVASDGREQSAFQTRTEDHFKTIEKSLIDLGHPSQLGKTATPSGGSEQIVADVKRQELESSSNPLHRFQKMDQKTFAASLSALRSQIQQVSFVNGRPDSSTLRSIAEKLAKTDENAPEYWPTVLQFIKYASAQYTGDVPPPGPPKIILRDNDGFGIRFPPITHSVILLDGGDVGPLHVENSRVIFTDHAVHFRNVRFVNCVFEMPDVVAPSQYLKSAVKDLLASNLAAIPGL